MNSSGQLDRDPSDLPSETFCALPWMHISSRPNGHMRVCCTANASGVQNKNSTLKTGSDVGVLKRDDGKPANLATTGLLEAWNNTYMKTVRKQMLAGERPASCLKCFKEEDAGHRSKRQWETAKWVGELGLEDIIGQTEADGSVPARVRYVDLRLGSKCQLACIMCSPHDSSNWIKEHKQIWPHLKNERLKYSMQWEKESGKLAWTGGSYAWHKNNPTFWDEFWTQVPTLRQLYWAGGESLIMAEHYMVLEKIIEMGYAKNIELRYNSNGLEWEDHLFDLWKEFKQVIFHFSIDSYADKNHFIRYPSPWRIIKKRMHQLDDYPHGNLRLTTATTITALSMVYLPEFISWKLQEDWKLLNRFPAGAGMIDLHLAYWPPQLNVKALPKWYKAEVKEKFDEFIPWLEENWRLCNGVDDLDFAEWRELPYGVKRLEGLVSFMNSEDWSERLPEMAEWCYTVAEKRNLDFNEIFPDLEWLEWYKV